MQFTIVDAEAAYRRMLAAPDAGAREAIFRDEIVAPFEGMARFFGGDGLAAFRQWGLSPEPFAGPERAHTAAIIERLAEADAWGRAARALERGWAALAPYAAGITTRQITFGLYLCKMDGNPLQRGYSGFGAIPGWVMTVYGEPDPYNLARVEPATAHELHHNVRFALHPFSPMSATLGDYIVAEGLAEAFAAELYGEELVGYYVSEFDEGRLAESMAIIGAALDHTGFDRIRGYVFGDLIAEQMGLPRAGVPNFAGYALGYRLVQHYLANTGSSVAAATALPTAQIIAGSGFFA